MKEQDIEDDRGERAEGDARAEDDLNFGSEGVRDVGLGGNQHGQAQARADDDHVAVVVEVDLRQRLYADHGDGGEHRQRRPTQHRVRDPRDNRTGLGDGTEHDHEHAGRHHHPAALDLRQPHQPDVLGKTGIGEGVEDPTQGRGQAIGAQRGRNVLLADPFVDDLPGGEDVTGSLDRSNDHHDDHRQDRRNAEGGDTEEERRGDSEQTGVGDCVELRIAQTPGHQCAGDQTDQDGDGL